jgi:GNAT superfamily N-acetyltransferase
MLGPGMNVPRAIEVFVTAFGANKSRTHPYLVEQHEVPGGVLWTMADKLPRRNPRKSEVIVYHVQPEVAVEHAHALVGWHFLGAMLDGEEQIGASDVAYKALGYRPLASERFFVHDMKDVPVFTSEPPVRLIESAAQLATIPQQVPQPRRWMEDLRQYAIWDEIRDYGWVTSRDVGRDSWVGDLWVPNNLRRRGYGRALMSRLLQDDRDLGREWSVLLSSTVGSYLYPQLGYRQIGVLRLYCPKRS